MRILFVLGALLLSFLTATTASAEEPSLTLARSSLERAEAASDELSRVPKNIRRAARKSLHRARFAVRAAGNELAAAYHEMDYQMTVVRAGIIGRSAPDPTFSGGRLVGIDFHVRRYVYAVYTLAETRKPRVTLVAFQAIAEWRDAAHEHINAEVRKAQGHDVVTIRVEAALKRLENAIALCEEANTWVNNTAYQQANPLLDPTGKRQERFSKL